MQPELPSAPVSWTDLSGSILPGGYELKELLEADGAAAQFRVRVLGDRELDAVAQFIQVSAEEADRQIAIWELMRELRHPNLTVPLGAGNWERNGQQLGYIVLRRADESLDGALAERALTPLETREVAISLMKGLETLHLHGLVHGCLSPEQVLAVADSIQLPITCIRHSGAAPEVPLVMPKYLAPESEDEEGEAGENVTSESDVWCLGATIFEALTRKEWTEESREETAALPEPFATVALRCLEEEPANRCNLAEAMALVKGDIKPAPRVKTAAAAVGSAAAPLPVQTISAAVTPAGAIPVAVSESVAAPVAVKTEAAQNLAPAPAQEPIPNFRPAPQPISKPKPVGVPNGTNGQSATAAKFVSSASAPMKTAASKPGPTPFPERKPTVVRNVQRPLHASSRNVPVAARGGVSKRWIWAAAALVLVMGIVWLLRPKAQSPAVTTKPAAPVAKNQPAGETKVLQPDGTAVTKVAPPPAKAEVRSAPAVPALAKAAGARRDIWHVILYAYGRSEDAERMAQALNKRHPTLQAQVFSTKENEGPYLVTAGGGMTKEEAAQARRTAVGNGMPRDSYIQNFNR